MKQLEINELKSIYGGKGGFWVDLGKEVAKQVVASAAWEAIKEGWKKTEPLRKSADPLLEFGGKVIDKAFPDNRVEPCSNRHCI